VISLVDSHAHIHGAEFESDRPEVMARARAAGVDTIVTVGTDLASSMAALTLAKHDSGIWATAGVHPHEAEAASTEQLQRIEELAAALSLVAIGEIGLDYHYDHSPRAEQIRAFEDQLEIANRLELPVVVHSRDADDDTFGLLSSWSARRRSLGLPPPYGVMHCYAYGAARLDAYVELGMLISISGIVTYPRAEGVQAAAAVVADESLLIETDCPYLAPQSRRGRRNEPCLLPETATKVAAIRGVAVEIVAQQTTDNARRLFRLPEYATARQSVS
jgi:TatD DNase family protein